MRPDVESTLLLRHGPRVLTDKVTEDQQLIAADDQVKPLIAVKVIEATTNGCRQKEPSYPSG